MSEESIARKHSSKDMMYVSFHKLTFSLPTCLSQHVEPPVRTPVNAYHGLCRIERSICSFPELTYAISKQDLVVVQAAM